MTTNISPTELLTQKMILRLPEASSISGVSVSTLKRENKLERLKFTRMSARRVGIRVDHLSEWLDSRVA
jgi:predicted DNA-binding transcriptional regulator AlpA